MLILTSRAESSFAPRVATSSTAQARAKPKHERNTRNGVDIDVIRQHSRSKIYSVWLPHNDRTRTCTLYALHLVNKTRWAGCGRAGIKASVDMPNTSQIGIPSDPKYNSVS